MNKINQSVQSNRAGSNELSYVKRNNVCYALLNKIKSRQLLERSLQFFAVLLFVGVCISCKKMVRPVADSVDRLMSNENRPVLYALAEPQVKPLPVVTREEWESGSTTPGDHTQHMLGLAYCESSPDRIYMAEDVSGVWASRDFGHNWFTLKNQGLYSPFMIAIEADPLDKNRVVAAAQCRQFDAANKSYQGIYLSKDGGITWQRKQARTQLDEVRSSTRLIAYAPSSKNTALGYAKRWYAAFGEGDTGVDDDGLQYSNDGGETWTEIRKLPSTPYSGKIRGIKVHVKKQERLFLYGDEGLFLFQDATNPEGKVTKLSGQGGLPQGEIWGSLYQSPDGNTLIVAVSKIGIYKSVNGGDTWHQLYGWGNINYCYVNVNFPNKIFAVPTEKSTEQIRISNNGGETWFSPAKEDVVYRPGYDNSDWNKKLNGQFTYILPDPRDQNKVFIHTTSKNFRSDDGGLHWYPSDNGFNGAQHTGSWQEQMFDPVNPDRFCYFMVDRSTAYTDTRGRWFYPSTIRPGLLGLNGRTCMAGALHPTEPVILASVGQQPVGQLLRSADNGKTWTVVSTGNKQRWVVAFDLQNPDTCYQWRERSSDAGKTWKQMANMPANAILCGVSRSNGSVLYALDFKNTGKKVWRSVNRGDTWEQVIESPWNLTMPGDDPSGVFRVDPQNPDIVYTSSASGQITRWDVSTLPARSTEIVFPGSGEPNFFINRFAIDPRHPEIMYALNLRANTGNKFFRTVDGGISWQNISAYIPGSSENGLAVSPVTGEVYISGQNGSVVMLPPYPASNTAYEAVPYLSNHLNEPY